MKLKNKFRLWWINHGFGNKVKSTENWINSLVEDEGWILSSPFKANSPEEALQKGLDMLREEKKALDHVYMKVKK